MGNEDILMALKNGNVPSKGVKDLAIGRDKEIEEFKRLLEKVDNEDKAIVKFLNGEFVAGKSFFLKVIEDIAYEQNFVVSWITIGPQLPLNKIDVVYRNIAKTLRCKTGTSLEHIIKRWITHLQMVTMELANDKSEERKILLELVHDELEETRNYSSAFARAIENYAKLLYQNNMEGCSAVIAWLRGDENIPHTLKQKFGIKGEINKESALDFLGALSIFIKSIGYSGLVILIDEVEYVMKLRTQDMRDAAYNYMRDIYDNCNLGKFQSSLFIFAGTNDLFEDSRGISSYEALDDRIKHVLDTDLIDMRTPVVKLQGFDKNEIIEFSQKILEMHSEVYNWDAAERFNFNLIDQIAEKHVSDASWTGGRVTARIFIRKFISLLDTVQQNQEVFNTPEDIQKEFDKKSNEEFAERYDDFDDDF